VSRVADRGDEIGRLMARGLDLYALGQVEEATACWRRVLAIDPSHGEARDYLQAAGADTDPPPPRATPRAAPRPDGLLAEALVLLRAGDVPEALGLLETLARHEPANLEVQAFLELARAAALRVFRVRVGSGEGVPRLQIPQAEVLKFNLPAAAGFLLSMIDGHSSVDELLAVSGMDPFEALRALSNLLDAGIVGATA
jgi:tetratricopeptide (TPR) repeat protein